MARASARGVVSVEVAGKTRRLRLSLRAIDELETELGGTFQELGEKLATTGVGTAVLLTMLRVMAAAAGDPIPEEELDDILPSDLPDVLAALEAAMTASGAIEAAEGEGGAKKKELRSQRRGASGKNSRSG